MPAKDQGFTEDQIEDFKEVFQLFDTKGDGLIQVRLHLHSWSANAEQDQRPVRWSLWAPGHFS